MELCIIGTGYVGLTTAACLAEIGHRVVAVDSDTEKLAILCSGGMPIYEPSLEELVRKNVAASRLTFTGDLAEGVAQGRAIFICVGTPSSETGDADLSAVEAVARRIAETARGRKLIIEKSTVPVRTGAWVEKTLHLYGREGSGDFEVASCPEFLREGSAVEDFFHPDRIVVGVSGPWAEGMLREIYGPILEGSFECPVHARCGTRDQVPYLVTDIASAELIKHASNSFLALKISFINAVADLCERVGADVLQVAEGMGLDRRIGRAWLDAGIGFGGFCFPKDLQAFVRIAEKAGCDLTLLREAERINHARIDLVVEKLRTHLWVLRGKVVAILGLAFKPNTDDVRFAPALEIIRRLQAEGVEVRAYDPKAMERAARVLTGVTFARDPYEAGADAEALVIATEWDEFRSLDLARLKGTMRRPLVVDGRNLFGRKQMESSGFEYVGIGR
ncbi:MAG: UDP-glucose dehydrogenase family protein [Candidatus Methylomirabilales bacterium]